MDDLTSPVSTGSDDAQSLVSPDGDVPFKGSLVKDPGENDVLCGRGGSINSHPGNERFRTLVERRKRVYLTARFKREKRLIASSIVSDIRALDPPGRFLTRDTKSGLWRDIGDEKARDKTSQALRENAPSIRAEIETEISEQRAEMHREEEEAARSTAAHPAPSYYGQGWAYPYYGFHPPPPPPPPPPGQHAAQVPAHHAVPYPPPPPPQYPHYVGGHDPYANPPVVPRAVPKSALEQTAALVASGAESIKSWMSLAVPNSTSSADGQDSRPKPISYIHEDGSRKRRMVKFSADTKLRRSSLSAGPCYSPVQGSGNSILDDAAGEVDIEPAKLDAEDHEGTSIMVHFANQILGSIGSWETSTIVCGYDNSEERAPFPASSTGQYVKEEPVEQYDDYMEIEWEGQEVQLVEKNEQDSVASDERMPPPFVRRPATDQASSVAYSSLGSCHSWIPEQLGGAASFFGALRNGAASSVTSMDMEFSAAGTENFSAGGSLGGSSLTRVFETDEPPEEDYAFEPTSQNNATNREINQMPSWERSLRSKSPLSVGSGGGDDESLVSKSSSKVSEGGGLASGNVPTSPILLSDDIEWQSRE